MIQIITYPINVGATAYLTADKIDVEACIKAGTLNEALVGVLKRQGQISDLTPEKWAIATAQRSGKASWPPRGFTAAEIEKLGLPLPEHIAPAKVAAPAAPPTKHEKAKAKPAAAVRMERIELTADAVRVREFYLQPSKRGNFTYWTAADLNGRILRDKLFKSHAAGVEWLEAFSTQASAAATPAEQPAPETSNDGDVRPDLGGAEGQDPPADR